MDPKEPKAENIPIMARDLHYFLVDEFGLLDNAVDNSTIRTLLIQALRAAEAKGYRGAAEICETTTLVPEIYISSAKEKLLALQALSRAAEALRHRAASIEKGD